MRLFSMALAGATTGLLLGVLVGLSASPVVSTLLGALVTLAAAFLGLSNPHPLNGPTLVDSEDAHLRRFGVAALAAACLCGVIVGLAMRTRDALGVTPAELVARWTEAGYPAERAREIVALRVAGVAFPNTASAAETVTLSQELERKLPPSAQIINKTAVMAMLGPCGQLKDSPDANSIEREFAAAGGKWRAFTTAVARASQDQRAALLATGLSLACE